MTSTVVAAHNLCPECWAKIKPEPGIFEDKGEPACCVCGRPGDEGVCIPIYPNAKYLPCAGCAARVEAAQRAQQESEAAEARQVSQEEAPETPESHEMPLPQGA